MYCIRSDNDFGIVDDAQSGFVHSAGFCDCHIGLFNSGGKADDLSVSDTDGNDLLCGAVPHL